LPSLARGRKSNFFREAIVINPTASTYQVTITEVTAKGSISNQTIVLPGLPIL
jgi:hypothetical protein